jgi:hypothetical protein
VSGFDRIRRPSEGAARPSGIRAADPAGRAALFSAGATPAASPGGGLALHCSRCGASSPLDAGTALRAAFPLFLVAPWRRHQVFAVCPACCRRAWLRLGYAT